MPDQPARPATLLRAVGSLLGAFADYAGWRGVRAGALVAVAAVLEGAGLLTLVPILGVVVDAASGGRHGMVSSMLARFGATTPLAQLGLLLAVFAGVSMVRALAMFARDTALARLQTGFIEHERNRAMQVLARAPWSRVVGLRHARVTNLITTELQRLASACFVMIQGGVMLAMIAIQTILAFSLAPLLATIAVALLLVGAAVFVATQGRTRDMGARMVLVSQSLMGSATSFLSGLKTAAAQNAQASFVAEFETIQRQVRATQLGFQIRQARGRLVFAIVSSMLGAAVVLIGFGPLNVPPAILITLVLVFGRISGPAMQLYQSGQQFVFAVPSFESSRALEAELSADPHHKPAEPVPPPPGPIELAGVGYVHPSGRGVRDVTLSIPAGSFVGVAGPSGAGKTTLIDVIVGLLEPQQGRLSVGGEIIDNAAKRAGWAAKIAYVSQEGFLFHDSVRFNLGWANGQVSDGEIVEALAFAGATELVAKMEHGLDTVVGERGTLLSGGERQRIGLARALLRKPRLLVLDEAANAIDAPSEAALLDRLKALDPRPTILMISHREENLGWCDRVIRVDDGKVSG